MNFSQKVLLLLLRKPKFHHLLVLFAGFMISIRVTHLWELILQSRTTRVCDVISVNQVQAETSPSSKNETKANPDPKEQPSEIPEKKIEADEKTTNDPVKEPIKAEEDFDPLSLDEKQVKILMSLAEKQREEDSFDQKMKANKALLDLSEKKAQEKLEELEKTRAKLEELIKVQEEKDKENTKKLVKVYESMKPTAAAQIFNQLDMAILVPIAQQMAQKKLSAILSEMDVKKARDLTTLIATVNAASKEIVQPQFTSTEEQPKKMS
jgi:flagellar motility protein MotE (MotC chaperone)